MSYDVYGVGNAIMDLQLQCDDSVLDAIGVEKGIMTLTEEAQQQHVLARLSDHSVNQCSGGSAANTIVGVADFGGKGAYACKVGADDFGKRYLDEMRKLGIAIEVDASDGQTGSCVVLITPDAQRTMLTHLGVSATLGPDDINAAEIAKAQYVYIEGYLFTGDSTKAAALKAIELAKTQGVKVALTVSDPFLIDLFRDQFIELIEGPVDLLFCNEQEARALTGFDDPVDCAQTLHKHTENVALTLGSNGSILIHDGEVIAVESVPVAAVDTTGAGDMYAAGVLYGITNGLSWQQAGHLGSHAAAQIVSRLGARLPKSYTQQEIQALIG
ncbi:MAG: adenosine kinase [Mariprofundaceae bacterium]|nr:adenosine kinase [Mariprofundaceae bacterium]